MRHFLFVECSTAWVIGQLLIQWPSGGQLTVMTSHYPVAMRLPFATFFTRKISREAGRSQMTTTGPPCLIATGSAGVSVAKQRGHVILHLRTMSLSDGNSCPN